MGETIRTSSTPAESMARLEAEWDEFGRSLDALSVGTEFTINKAPGAVSFEGTWERVDLGGDPFWHNLDTDDYRTSREFRVVRGQIDFETKKCSRCNKPMNPVQVMLSSGNEPLLCKRCIKAICRKQGIY